MKKKYLFIILFYIFALPLFSEDCKSAEDLKMAISNPNILVGDIINYEISFKVDKDSDFYIKEPNFEPFELIKKKATKIKDKSGNFYQKFYLDLSIYKTGQQEIPSFEVVSVNKDTQSCITIPKKVIMISSLLKKDKQKAGIKDIKGTIEIKEKTYAILWALGVFLTTLILFFIYRFFHYKTSINKKEIIIKKIDPVDLAYKKLSKLTSENLLKDNLIKEYYFRLSEIIREYLGGVYEFDSVEMTTDELKDKINKIPTFKREYTELVNNFLDDTDFVKFSKFEPTANDTARATEIAFNIIEKLKPYKVTGEK